MTVDYTQGEAAAYIGAIGILFAICAYFYQPMGFVGIVIVTLTGFIAQRRLL